MLGWRQDSAIGGAFKASVRRGSRLFSRPDQRRWAQTGSDHLMAELFMSRSAQLRLYRRFPAPVLRYMQFASQCLDPVSSRNVQRLLVEVMFSPTMGNHPSQSLPGAYLSPRYQSGQWQEYPVADRVQVPPCRQGLDSQGLSPSSQRSPENSTGQMQV